MTDLLTGLLEESRQLGFLGPGPIEPHLHHAAAFAAALTGPPARALDLGAGGGLPGLVLAATTWPDTAWTFLDAQQRRTDFLHRAVSALGLAARVSVITDRAEVVGRDVLHRGNYDLVVARSFGLPAVTAECAAPLLSSGGLLVVSEPPSDADAPLDRWPDDGVAQLGLSPAELLVIDGPVHLARLRLVAPVDLRYPRRTGVPAKRPLF